MSTSITFFFVCLFTAGHTLSCCKISLEHWLVFHHVNVTFVKNTHTHSHTRKWKRFITSLFKNETIYLFFHRFASFISGQGAESRIQAGEDSGTDQRIVGFGLFFMGFVDFNKAIILQPTPFIFERHLKTCGDAARVISSSLILFSTWKKYIQLHCTVHVNGTLLVLSKTVDEMMVIYCLSWSVDELTLCVSKSAIKLRKAVIALNLYS